MTEPPAESRAPARGCRRSARPRPTTSGAGPSYPPAVGRPRSSTSSGIGPGAGVVRPRRRHRQVHAAARRRRARRRRRRAGRRHAAASWPTSLPDVEVARRHGRGDPARRRRRSTPSPSPRRSTGSTLAAALAEIARVLRPGGGLALVWNERDESVPWVAELDRDHRVAQAPPRRAYQTADWASRCRPRPARSARWRTRSVPWDQPMTRALLAARVRSISYIARRSPADEQDRVRRPGARRSCADAVELRPTDVRARRYRRPQRSAGRERGLREPLARELLGVVGAARRHDLPWRRDAATRGRVLVSRADAPADAGAAGRRRGTRRSSSGSRRRPRAPPRRPATSSGPGPGSATTAGRSTSTGARRPSSSATTARCPTTSTRCSRCPASGRTRRGPCSCSPSSTTSGSSTPTPAASSPGRWPVGPCVRRRRRRSPTRPCPPAAAGRGARRCSTSAPRLHPAGAACATLPAARPTAPGPAGSPPPDPVTASAGIVGGQSRFDGRDRQGRGRLVDALRAGPVARADARRASMGWPDDRASRRSRVAADACVAPTALAAARRRAATGSA